MMAHSLRDDIRINRGVARNKVKWNLANGAWIIHEMARPYELPEYRGAGALLSYDNIHLFLLKLIFYLRPNERGLCKCVGTPRNGFVMRLYIFWDYSFFFIVSRFLWRQSTIFMVNIFVQKEKRNEYRGLKMRLLILHYTALLNMYNFIFQSVIQNNSSRRKIIV